MISISQADKVPAFTPHAAFQLAEPFWYALHTRARHERKVAAKLEEKGIRTFVPAVTQRRRWSDRWVEVQQPLFSCYTFVQVVPSDRNRVIIHQTPGVLRFVGSAGSGTPIPEGEIEAVIKLIAGSAAYEPHPYLTVGRRVRIRSGALDGLEGILVAKNNDWSLVVSLNLIQQSVAVRLYGIDVEMI